MLRARSIPVLIFPILLTIGIVIIPLVPSYSDHGIVVQAVEQTGSSCLCRSLWHQRVGGERDRG